MEYVADYTRMVDIATGVDWGQEDESTIIFRTDYDGSSPDHVDLVLVRFAAMSLGVPGDIASAVLHYNVVATNSSGLGDFSIMSPTIDFDWDDPEEDGPEDFDMLVSPPADLNLASAGAATADITAALKAAIGDAAWSSGDQMQGIFWFPGSLDNEAASIRGEAHADKPKIVVTFKDADTSNQGLRRKDRWGRFTSRWVGQ